MMWAKHLSSTGFPVILFDAFANDYQEDAYLALAGEVLALASLIPIATLASVLLVDGRGLTLCN
jgi:hypothetical protein